VRDIKSSFYRFTSFSVLTVGWLTGRACGRKILTPAVPTVLPRKTSRWLELTWSYLQKNRPFKQSLKVEEVIILVTSTKEVIFLLVLVCLLAICWKTTRTYSQNLVESWNVGHRRNN